MHRNSRMTTVVTLIAVAAYGLLPALAAGEVSVRGTVEIPCDPSRLGEVVSVSIRLVPDGTPVTVPVDPETGVFGAKRLTPGEYELFALDADGQPLSPEPLRLGLAEGVNAVKLELSPPGCEEQAQDEPLKKRRNKRLEDWQITLIYFGAIGALAIALDDEDSASPMMP